MPENKLFLFRVNTDWLWDNFPNERRFASMIFIADNILEPEVIQTIYRVRKSVQELVTPGKFIRFIMIIVWQHEKIYQLSQFENFKLECYDYQFVYGSYVKISRNILIKINLVQSLSVSGQCVFAMSSLGWLGIG